MALADSRNSIGATSRLIADHLIRRTGHPVSVGRPEAAAGGTAASFNLFLFEVSVDGSMRNVPLHEGEPDPLWLVLKYLLTAFDDGGESESEDAHDLLGGGMSALQEIAILQLDQNAAANVRAALESNPEPLKITFDQTPPDLINKLMQASDDEYRISISFEVRPILIVPPVPTRSSLLVGVDYSGPPVTGQPDFVGIDVLGSLGPKLGSLEPGAFGVGDDFTVKGDDLHLANLSAWLGDAELGITMQRADQLTIEVPDAIGSGTLISAGEHPLVLRQYLPETGRSRKSNLLVGGLLPTVTAATPGVMTADSSGFLSGDISIDGLLLGTAEDTIQIAFFANARVAQTVEIAKTPLAPGDPADQQLTLILTLTSSHRVVAGSYLLIVLVNGQQARFSPNVYLAP